MPRSSRFITAFKKSEIDQLFKAVTFRIQKSGLDIRLVPASGQLNRILIIIPKKFGTAPERNRLKRRLKAIFYEEKLYTLPYTVIIIAHRQAQALTFAELKNILLSIYPQ